MRVKYFVIILFTISLPLWGQSIKFPDPTPTFTPTVVPTPTPEPQLSENVSLPKGYRDLLLGMTFEEVKEILKEDLHFDYQGPADVTMLTKPNESLIETDGTTFIEKGFFQFYKEKLYIIILEINRTRMDYFTMYSSFVEKYGEPESLDPSKVVWKNETHQLTLEKPLTVKYIDLETFTIINRGSEIEDSFFQRSRKEFLDEF